MSFDAWLDEGESGENNTKKLTVENIKQSAKERVREMFTEEAFGSRIVQILNEMD